MQRSDAAFTIRTASVIPISVCWVTCQHTHVSRGDIWHMFIYHRDAGRWPDIVGMVVMREETAAMITRITMKATTERVSLGTITHTWLTPAITLNPTWRCHDSREITHRPIEY